MLPMLPLIEAEWPAPPPVLAGCTTRRGGLSRPPYDSLNLGLGCGDERRCVLANRERLEARLGGRWHWLEQVHGTRIIEAPDADREADGAVCGEPGQTLLVITADCLPVLFCDRAGTRIGAVHAGWRGLAAGILELAVERLERPGAELLAWIGPAISGPAYEVGAEVRAALLAADPGGEGAFRPTRPGHWTADLPALARRRLRAAGLPAVFGGRRCTFAEAGCFFSHRRDGTTGRQASFIQLRRH